MVHSGRRGKGEDGVSVLIVSSGLATREGQWLWMQAGNAVGLREGSSTVIPPYFESESLMAKSSSMAEMWGS